MSREIDEAAKRLDFRPMELRLLAHMKLVGVDFAYGESRSVVHAVEEVPNRVNGYPWTERDHARHT